MQRLIALIVLAGVIIAGSAAVDSAGERIGDAQTVDNESFTPTGDAVSKVSASDTPRFYYADSATVYHNSAVVPAAGNYSWNAGNGTLRVTNNSYLANQSSANLSFEYSVPEQHERDLIATISEGMDVLDLLLWVIGIAAVIGAVRVFIQ